MATFKVMDFTCTGGYICDARMATKDDLIRTMQYINHAIIIAYDKRAGYPVSKALEELSKEKAPNLRAIYLGPWSGNRSTLWMLRQGPEITGERDFKNVV